MVYKFPPLLGYNVEPVLKPKLQFLVNSMGRQVYEVVEYPRYFSYSLEKRIIPRARVIERRQISCDLKSMLAKNDDEFAAEFLGFGRMLIPTLWAMTLKVSDFILFIEKYIGTRSAHYSGGAGFTQNQLLHYPPYL